MQWYYFRSKDKRVQGYCPRSKKAIARFAGYPVKELKIEPVEWNGEEFVKCQKKG